MVQKKFQLKHKHHYVWQKYLKSWCNNELEIYHNTKRGKIIPTSTKGLVVEDFFYKIQPINQTQIDSIIKFSLLCGEKNRRLHESILSNIIAIKKFSDIYKKSNIKDKDADILLEAIMCNFIENHHTKIESNALPIINELILEKIEIFKNKDYIENYISYISEQFTRTKKAREDLIKSISSSSHIVDDQLDRENKINISLILSIILAENIKSYLIENISKYKISMLINETSTSFITSDQPVINIKYFKDYGNFSDDEINLYHPISPKIAIMISPKNSCYHIEKIKINLELADTLNKLISKNANMQIFGNSEISIQPYIKYIGVR